MTEQPDQLLLRATANALWPFLRRRRWKPRKVTRSISPTGNPHGNRYGSGHIPGPEPTLDVLMSDPYVEAVAIAAETRLGFGIAVALTRADCFEALARVPANTAAEYEEALGYKFLRFSRPFTWEIDRYRRNRDLPRRAALALLAVANAATVTRLTPEQESTLYDAPDDVSLSAVLAALERGGA